MTTSKQPAKIRRAKPTDVVNLYRLLAEGQEQNSVAPVDETLALGYVLTVIEKGLVMVAEHSGRLVGSIGFDTYRTESSKETALKSAWFPIVPAYKQTTIGLALLQRALAIIDEYDVQVLLSISTDEKRVARWLTTTGFEPFKTVWLREGQKKKDEPASDTEETPDGEQPDTGAEPEPVVTPAEPAPADELG